MKKTLFLLDMLGLLLLSDMLAGCKTLPVPPSPPPLRPLTQEIFNRIENPLALQYYISSWVILEYENIPDYPESIGVQDFPNITTPPYAPIPNRIDVNPKGTAQLQYDNLYRVILINELTRGALLTTLSGDDTTLEICFEQNREHTLRFRLDDSTGHYRLDQCNGMKIQYGDITYTQWLRETPILLIRMEEDINRTLRFLSADGHDIQSHTADGREPPLSSFFVPK